MKSNRNDFYANHFYSYSHRDAQQRSNMEEALTQLRRDGLLKDWSDLKILPGQSISKNIREKMDAADIFVFLLSRDFISSHECMKETDNCHPSGCRCCRLFLYAADSDKCLKYAFNILIVRDFKTKYYKKGIRIGAFRIQFLFNLFQDKHLLFQRFQILGRDVIFSCHLQFQPA